MAPCQDGLTSEDLLLKLDQSVDAALRKHPRRKRLAACLLVDLSEARVPGEEPAFPKWDARVKRWAEWASELRMLVESECWGSSEPLECLTKPEHIERVGNGGSEPTHPRSIEGCFGDNLFTNSYKLSVFN